MRELRDRFELLTPRERAVMQLVVSGRLNKQIGGALGISEITVKAHRGQMMRKMDASSLAHLVKIAEKLRSYGSHRPSLPDFIPFIGSFPFIIALR